MPLNKGKAKQDTKAKNHHGHLQNQADFKFDPSPIETGISLPFAGF